jgi:integrase/recombinase XerD
MAEEKPMLAERWPVVAACAEALGWLQVQADLGLAPRTIDAYARGLTDYLAICSRDGIDPLLGKRTDVAHYVHDLRKRTGHRRTNVVSFESGVGLANATLQQRLVAVRLF